MRTLLVAAVVLPLLAGCIDGDSSIAIEAFEATYETGDGWTVRMTFGSVVDYLAADGKPSQGYSLDVDYGTRSDGMGRGQSILDGTLHLQRFLWCNGWSGDDPTCVHEQYDWALPGDRGWPASAHFGVAANVAPPLDEDVSDHITYDDKLAPVRYHWGADTVFERTSYKSLGPLGPLTDRGLAAPSRLAPTGPGFVGGDAPLPGLSFSPDEALAYLREQDDGARAMLDAGGCVAGFRAYNYPGQLSNQLPILLADQTEERLSLTLTDGTTVRAFEVGYGRKAPLGEPGFTGYEEEIGSQPVDCTARPAVAPLDTLLALATETGGVPRFYYGGWRLDGQGFYVDADTDVGRLTITGQGLLQTLHLPRDAVIDP